MRSGQTIVLGSGRASGSPDGEFYGNVDMPIGLDVMDITADYVLGVTRDDLDVKRVELRALRRADRP